MVLHQQFHLLKSRKISNCVAEERRLISSSKLVGKEVSKDSGSSPGGGSPSSGPGVDRLEGSGFRTAVKSIIPCLRVQLASDILFKLSLISRKCCITH